jgi:hypothetical protein
MSVVMGDPNGPKTVLERLPRRRFRDKDFLRARDIVIVKMREGLLPFRQTRSWREIGRELGRSHVFVRMRYLDVPEPVKEDIRRGRLE